MPRTCPRLATSARAASPTSASTSHRSRGFVSASGQSRSWPNAAKSGHRGCPKGVHEVSTVRRRLPRVRREAGASSAYEGGLRAMLRVVAEHWPTETADVIDRGRALGLLDDA
jgi:hypothetical protein